MKLCGNAKNYLVALLYYFKVYHIVYKNIKHINKYINILKTY